MKKFQTLVAITAVLTSVGVAGAGPAGASSAGDPVGDCPNSFVVHHVPQMHGDHEHNHVGNSDDRNGDGYVCVKPSGMNGKNHVHIDNNIPKHNNIP